jgi:hypothetical protein
MGDINIYNTWTNFINNEKYKEYFLDNKNIWLKKIDEVKKYIDIYNKRPSQNDKDSKIKVLSRWIKTQQKNYKIKKNIMIDNNIYNNWYNFINDDKYKNYFLDNNNSWIQTLKEVKSYIDIYKKRPSQHDKDSKIKVLGRWIGTQQKTYKNKMYIMSDNKKLYFYRKSKIIKNVTTPKRLYNIIVLKSKPTPKPNIIKKNLPKIVDLRNKFNHPNLIDQKVIAVIEKDNIDKIFEVCTKLLKNL